MKIVYPSNETKFLYAQEAELLLKISCGESDDLNSFFESRAQRWRYPLMMLEGCSVGTFDDLSARISKEQAFLLIPKAINIVLVQAKADLLLTALSLLSCLITISNTTEMPRYFLENVDVITDRMKLLRDQQCNEYWLSIRKWYRLH